MPDARPQAAHTGVPAPANRPATAGSAAGGFRAFQCHDAHEQAAMLQAWQQSYCQLSAGPFEGCVNTFDTGAVCIMVERLNRVLLQRGALPDGCVALGVPLQLQGHGRLAGARSHLDGLHVFSGESGFEYLSPDTHLVANIEFYPSRMASPALRAVVARIAGRLGRQATVHDLPAPQMAALRHTLRQMLHAVGQAPELLAVPTVCAAFERSLVHLIDALLDGEPPAAEVARPQKSWQLAHTVRQHLEAHPSDCPLSVGELATVLQVSRRTLQYAFQDAMGMNPVAYLRALRLNRVRRALRHTPSVTEAATQFGFWHFGHFATDYRALFNERPSDTARRYQGSGTAAAAAQAPISPRPAPDWLN